MIIQLIDPSNIHLLHSFLQNRLPSTFRYFDKRPITIINNHILTIVGTLDNHTISYGHIDLENNTFWVGLCVLPEYHSRGFGSMMLQFLILYAENNNISRLTLSVDITNNSAINLYKKYGFKCTVINNQYIKMEKKIESSIQTDKNICYLPVSIGEALDKLAILEIKQHQLKGTKLQEVKKEFDMLSKQLNIYFDDITGYNYQFHYKTLIQINKTIWNMQDSFRETNDGLTQTRLCMKIIQDNDRRFRIKNKINLLGKSHLKEQKGYTSLKAFVLTHIDLGDNITAIPAVRYISTLFDEVVVVCKQKNLKNVKMFYEDDPTISFHIVNDDNEISPYFGCPLEKFKEITQNYTIFTCGMHCGKGIKEIPWDFYDHLRIPPQVYWEYFHVPSTREGEELYQSIDQKYIFIHNSDARGDVYHLEYIETYFDISRDNILFINPTKNCYPCDHKLYDVAQKFIGHPLLDYKQIIENASYNIVSGSSFFCLAMNLDIKTEKNYYYIGGHSTYDYIWTKYSYPNTRKKFIQIPQID